MTSLLLRDHVLLSVKLKFNPQWRVGSQLEDSMMGALISDVKGMGGWFGLEQTTAGIVNIWELCQLGLFSFTTAASNLEPAQPSPLFRSFVWE